MIEHRSLRCSCRGSNRLEPIELEPGLRASGCGHCGGSLLGLADYKAWRDAVGGVVAASDLAVFEDVEDASGARACPGCARLMNRLRAGTRPDFRLDRCASCQSVWFDRGEWRALAAAGHASRLDAILSDAGQRQLQAEALRARREAALREKHGAECIDELSHIRRWLDAQPQRDELLALLRTGW
jgi:Zn-finger nucleic acid-binding protein